MRIAKPLKSYRVPVDLALIHETTLSLVHKLDRLFDGEDMVTTVVIDEVDHRSQLRGLTRTRRPRDQHQTPGQHGDVAKQLAHAPGIHRQHLRGNRSEDRARTAILIEGIDTKARDTRHLEGKVRLQEFFKILPVSVVHDVVDQRLNAGMVLSGHINAPHAPSTRIIGGRPAER